MKLQEIICNMVPKNDFGFLGSVSKEPFIWSVKNKIYQNDYGDWYEDHCANSIPYLTKNYFKNNKENPDKYLFIRDVVDYLDDHFYRYSEKKLILQVVQSCSGSWCWNEEHSTMNACDYLYRVSDMYPGLLERVK